MSKTTNVWSNILNGHRYEEGERGCMLNNRPVSERPDWVSGDPTFVFGPIYQWRGGPCPVPHNSFVRCLFRKRLPYIGLAINPEFPARLADQMWQHVPYPGRNNPGSDIVAFQRRIA